MNALNVMVSILMTIANHIVVTVCAEKGYAALFKSGVVLLGVALVAMSQVGIFLYDKDLSAHKARYTLELSVNQKIENIDCHSQRDLQLFCYVAKHEVETFDSSLKLLDVITQISMLVGMSLCVFSLLGFLLSPIVTKPVLSAARGGSRYRRMRRLHRKGGGGIDV